MKLHLFILALTFFFIQPLIAQNPPILINATDTVGQALPLQITDDVTGLTFGTNTFGRQIRLSRPNSFFDIGLNADSDFFITKKNSSVIALRMGDYGLVFAGTITSQKVKVKVTAWPDFVFHKNYNLLPLSQVEAYINANKHLPEMPSAIEIEQTGQDLGDINKKLVQKIEELTLYLIEQQKQIKAQNERIARLEKK